MENEYEVISNLNKETKHVYEKRYKSDNFELIINEDDVILAKKNNNNNINLEHEKLISTVLVSMLKKYAGQGILYINLTKEFNSILEKIKDIRNVRPSDNTITWPLRQAITKAIVDKTR